MSGDLIELVQSLISSGKGDIERLRRILDKLQQGKLLSNPDQNYLQDLAKQPGSGDKTAAPSTLSSISDPNTDTSKNTISHPQDADNNISNDRKDAFSIHRYKKRIATVAVIIGIILVAYMGLDAYAVETLQFRPHHGNQYLISQTQLFIQGEVCNPSFFPASFSKYEINAVYKSDSIEKADISGGTISPKTFEILNGEFDLNKNAVMKFQQQNETFNATQAHIITTVDAPIFGVIPFSVVKEYSADQFQQVLKNGPPGSFSCA